MVSPGYLLVHYFCEMSSIHDNCRQCFIYFFNMPIGKILIKAYLNILYNKWKISFPQFQQNLSNCYLGRAKAHAEAHPVAPAMYTAYRDRKV